MLSVILIKLCDSHMLSIVSEAVGYLGILKMEPYK